MSFLDPYGKDRRLPLLWIGRLALLALAAVVAVLAWWLMAD